MWQTITALAAAEREERPGRRRLDPELLVTYSSRFPAACSRLSVSKLPSMGVWPRSGRQVFSHSQIRVVLGTPLLTYPPGGEGK